MPTWMSLSRRAWLGMAGAGLVLTLTLLLAVHLGGAARESGMRSEQAAQLRIRSLQHSSELARLELAHLEEGQAQESRHREELARAVGGPIQAILRDVDSDLAGSITAVARHCLPTNAEVRVRVDRFTEFSLMITLPGPPLPRQLAAWSRCFLPHVGGPLGSVTFVHDGKVVGDLDRRALEAETDWEALSERELIARLVKSEAANPPSEPAPVARVGLGNEDETSDELLAVRQAYQVYAATDAAKVAEFNAALQQLNAYGSLVGLPTRADVERRRQLIGHLEERLRPLLLYFADPSAELDRELKVRNVDPVYARISVRNSRRDCQAGSVASSVVFAAFVGQVKSVGHFTEVMADQWGAWHLQADGQTIRFDSEAAQNAYQKVADEMKATVTTLDRAVAEWARRRTQRP